MGRSGRHPAPVSLCADTGREGEGPFGTRRSLHSPPLRPVASPKAAPVEPGSAEWRVMRSRVPCPSTSRSSTLVTCHPHRRHAATVGCSCAVFGVRYGSRSRKTSCEGADSPGREEAAREGGCAAEADWGPRRTRRLGEDIGTRLGVRENTAEGEGFGSPSKIATSLCVAQENLLQGGGGTVTAGTCGSWQFVPQFVHRIWGCPSRRCVRVVPESGPRSSWKPFRRGRRINSSRRKRFRDLGVTTRSNSPRSVGLNAMTLGGHRQHSVCTRGLPPETRPDATPDGPMTCRHRFECFWHPSPHRHARDKHRNDRAELHFEPDRHGRSGRPRKHSACARSVRGARSDPPAVPVGDEAEQDLPRRGAERLTGSEGQPRSDDVLAVAGETRVGPLLGRRPAAAHRAQGPHYMRSAFARPLLVTPPGARGSACAPPGAHGRARVRPSRRTEAAR